MDDTDVLTLSQKAFDDPQSNVQSSQAALKSVANTLLLKEPSRQEFVDAGYAAQTADRLRVTGDDRQEEMICSRILFLLTYNTKFAFDNLFDDHTLAESIHHVCYTLQLVLSLSHTAQNIAFHASKYSGQNLREDELKDGIPIYQSQTTDYRALSETLKLLFNLNQFYPDRASAFNAILPHILTILNHIYLQSNPLQPPVNYLINALLNLELPGTGDTDLSGSLFPDTDPCKHTERLVCILEKAIQSCSQESLEASAVPLLTLLRRINEIAPEEVRQKMQSLLLPSDTERDQPLGNSDTLASRLLRLSTTLVAPQVKEGISSLLFELSDKDPSTFVRNVGYGYAAGYLMTHKIPIPEASLQEDLGEKVTNVDGQEVNPVTGQRRDMEPPDPGLDMTDEEKEREAERLFVLFERLKTTGVMNVTNPVEQAAKEGKLHEITEVDSDG